MMEKGSAPAKQNVSPHMGRQSPPASPLRLPTRRAESWRFRTVGIVGLLYVSVAAYRLSTWFSPDSPYGIYPRPGDPFHFLPCTNATILPALNDDDASISWARTFDPDPDNWSWGIATQRQTVDAKNEYERHAGRGIYLCGYLDVPLDYNNKSDTRVTRLAVTKFQVSGLARRDGRSHPSAGHKSERTLVIEPGGPGGSGTSYLWRMGEELSMRLTENQFDVLGWDPRGVNATLPLMSCFQHDAGRDRWALIQNQYREVSPSPRAQLELVDAMNDAIFRACYEAHGDLPRFMTTALVSRDVDEIRAALGEPELTGYMVSYGTGIGQTYANMFPSRVGRLILDGTEYVMDHRKLGGFGWTALDNVTDGWRDGFLGECVSAGQEHCALAKPVGAVPVTVRSLDVRMRKMMDSLIKRPAVGYSSSGGPFIITYSMLVEALYATLYDPHKWSSFAQILYELELGNSTLATEHVEGLMWSYDPSSKHQPKPGSGSADLERMVICGDAYDAPLPASGLDWWESLWENMTSKDWIAGNSRFQSVFPCQHFTDYWPKPAEVYRGNLSHTLSQPVLLIAEIYDPATPLRNGRRLLNDMGKNARLIVHHGYGHGFKDKSRCTESLAKDYIMNGNIPAKQETNCYADEKPYRYGVDKARGQV